MAHPLSMTPLNSQEQRSCPMSTSTPTLIQEPEHEHASSQRTLVDNESIEQGALPQLDLSEDDGKGPPLLHVHPAKVELLIQIIKEWWSEIAMLALSILLFTVIVILLKLYDNHPMPSWGFHLNVNSMVAIISTLLRSCLFTILAQGLFNTTGHLSRSADESNYSNKSTEVELAYSSSSSSASTILRCS
jgi:uncharacterized protein DUF3176